MNTVSDFWEELQRTDPVQKGHQQLQELVHSSDLLIKGERWRLGLLYELLGTIVTELEQHVLDPPIGDPSVPEEYKGIHGYIAGTEIKQEALAETTGDYSLLNEASYVQKISALEQYERRALDLERFVKDMLCQIDILVDTFCWQRDREELDIKAKMLLLYAQTAVQAAELSQRQPSSAGELAQLRKNVDRVQSYETLLYYYQTPMLPSSPLDERFSFLPDDIDYQQLCPQVLATVRERHSRFAADPRQYFQREEEETKVLVEQILARKKRAESPLPTVEFERNKND